jgi:hypothetical protein
MKYILIANNDEIGEKINNLDLQSDDFVILFNDIKPIKYKKIRNHPNLIAFSRKKSRVYRPIHNVYAGLKTIKVFQNKFSKLIFHKSPDEYVGEIKKACYSALDRFGFLNSGKCVFIDDKNFIKKCAENKKSLSSGLIAYLYYSEIKKSEDKIVLLGFTSQLSSFHDCEWEKKFFLKEFEENRCEII